MNFGDSKDKGDMLSETAQNDMTLAGTSGEHQIPRPRDYMNERKNDYYSCECLKLSSRHSCMFGKITGRIEALSSDESKTMP